MLLAFDPEVIEQPIQGRKHVGDLNLIRPDVSMVALSRLVVVANDGLSRPAQVEAILEPMRPVPCRAGQLPKGYLNQEIALGGPEIEQ